MIAAFAPGSVSNVCCGFDVLGFALEAPGDLVLVEAAEEPGVVIAGISGDDGRLPHDPRRNTASVAVTALLERLGAARGIRISIEKGLALASGMGSSGASAVAAVVAANELLGRPAPLGVLLECAMEGEIVACGAAHPDNVAPSLYGGLVLARSAQPPDIVPLPVPDGLSCALLHPHLEVETGRCARVARRHHCAARRRSPVGEHGCAGRRAVPRRPGAHRRARSKITSPSPVEPSSCPALQT